MEAKKLKEIGYDVKEERTSLRIVHKGHEIVFWKKSKWFSGKTVNDGRGINNLLVQLVGEDKDEKHVDFYNNNTESYDHLIGIFQKHVQSKLSGDSKERIKAEMKSRFNISLSKQ